MAEKASSIIGHRRSQAGTNLSHPEEAPGEQSGTSSQAPPVNPSPVYPSTPRQAFQKPGSGYKKGEKSFLAKLFSFSGRMGRLAYFVLVVISDFYLFSFTSLPDDADELYYGLWLLALPLIAWVRIAGNARRCHDFGRSGWMQIIPFYILWMLFTPGDNFYNKYDS